jgi:hypothetical protein
MFDGFPLFLPKTTTKPKSNVTERDWEQYTALTDLWLLDEPNTASRLGDKAIQLPQETEATSFPPSDVLIVLLVGGTVVVAAGGEVEVEKSRRLWLLDEAESPVESGEDGDFDCKMKVEVSYGRSRSRIASEKVRITMREVSDGERRE